MKKWCKFHWIHMYVDCLIYNIEYMTKLQNMYIWTYVFVFEYTTQIHKTYVLYNTLPKAILSKLLNNITLFHTPNTICLSCTEQWAEQKAEYSRTKWWKLHTRFAYSEVWPSPNRIIKWKVSHKLISCSMFF